MKSELVAVSKFLSLVLRHRPEAIGISLDDRGWVAVGDLLAAARTHGQKITPALLEEVVFANDKQRFAFSPDGLRIRANQGHSVNVDLELEPLQPPEVLYHGTAERFLASIRERGLLKMRRQYVHLSATLETALNVGRRHGEPVVLVVRSREMFARGLPFYLSKNGVWLADCVPTEFIDREIE